MYESKGGGTRRWIPWVLGIAGLASCAASQLLGSENGRLGRPPEQIVYRGSSPYFKVDFDRYTGAGTCVWCHPDASRMWNEEESFHVDAYSLLDEEARQDPECVQCHVTAFNADGFYPLEDEAKQFDRALGFTWEGDPVLNARFEGVQCEACHGPNCGNKFSREKLLAGCERCHNEACPHFTDFDPAEAVELLVHAAAGAEEEVPYDSFQGIEACDMCHFANRESWLRDQSAHAGAFAVLAPSEREDPHCLRCHTTGFHREGEYPCETQSEQGRLRSGYELGGDPARNSRFEGVQCEACHGINCGTYTEERQIKERCLRCHTGECEHDEGFTEDAYLARVRHRPPADYQAQSPTKVTIRWYGLERGKRVARTWKMPLLVLLSNPPDG